jgi:YfiH family protein
MHRLPVIESPLLARLPHITHGFFTRQGGVSSGIYESLNCGLGSRDEEEKVKQNRSRVVAHLGADDLISGHQTHSTDVVFIDRPKSYQGDAAITKTRGCALGVLTADCAPILLADRDQPLIAALHAGWRGAVAGICDKAVQQLKQYGGNRLVAAIGPAISLALYDVGQDMKSSCVEKDRASASFFTPHGDKFRFDLCAYLQARLEQQGVEVDALPECTLGQPDKFFSHRYNKQRNITDYGRQISAIALC